MPTRLFLAGDSTMAEAEDFKYPQMGWGQTLQQYFTENLIVENHASSGRSTKSFIDEGRWDAIEREFQSGDFVLIQFGHNDQKPDEERATKPYTSYQDNLRFFVQRARSYQVTPLLLTSIARRHFDDTGKLKETHGDYPKAMRELAIAEQTDCLDMLLRTREALQQVGDESSKQWFMRLAPGEYDAYPSGEQDDTHLHERGAHQHCQLFVQELVRLQHPLAAFVQQHAIN
ncbi:rhamnogalacturonan acetylesterase [Gracilibacillus caseinilyticus]|uniref:Rhamnogalacturonan acetylesterase n=1 Tax=Gracilibacillus caseinilyticus TaxID=2932256 RepID=A0ABY4F2E0_9BACI|nr:rhamnogalacturonan acetylesterase [Gracilibacillus caseinilyticus]UOQ50039.1 rhamnogalacturonan acetylesterase [Gracilibacillus caseinilyticus]